MKRLTKEAAARIRARVNALPDDPDAWANSLLEGITAERSAKAELTRRLTDYWEALWFYESWVAALEQKLRNAGIDPADLGAA